MRQADHTNGSHECDCHARGTCRTPPYREGHKNNDALVVSTTTGAGSSFYRRDAEGSRQSDHTSPEVFAFGMLPESGDTFHDNSILGANCSARFMDLIQNGGPLEACVSGWCKAGGGGDYQRERSESVVYTMSV